MFLVDINYKRNFKIVKKQKRLASSQLPVAVYRLPRQPAVQVGRSKRVKMLIKSR